jgi:ATP-binding cassette, subfamily C (CFTR/MRP), member 1
LPAANRLIVLDGTGTIAQTGTFHELQVADGYVKSLALQQENSNGVPDGNGSASDVSSMSEGPVPLGSDDDNDKSRQLGDFKLYKFYLQSVGLFTMIMWLFISMAYIGIGKLPSMYIPKPSDPPPRQNFV